MKVLSFVRIVRTFEMTPKHPFIALLAREEKNKDVFSAVFFSFEYPFSTPLLCNISSKYPT